jgi:hypothetical protein
VSLILLFALAGAFPVLAAAAAESMADGAPRVLLSGANIPRAKALALDAALIKGWRVAESEPTHVVFEIDLDTPATAGPPGATPPERTLLRIRADFDRVEGGVAASLRAAEHWYAGTPQAWHTDVTDAYRTNLMNALQSLHDQWTAIAPAAAAVGARSHPERRSRPQPSGPTTAPGFRQEPKQAAVGRTPSRAGPAVSAPRPVLPESGIAAKPPEHDPVGVWAYHAEEYAAARGCVLGDRGAILVDDRDGSELHRVHCDGGGSVLVRCDRTACTDGQ